MKQANIFEEPDCPLCQKAGSATLYAWPEKPGYRVVRCTSCDFCYLSPRPQEEHIFAIYEDAAYYAGELQGYSNYEIQEAALGLTFRRLLQNLQKRDLTGGRLLEVGCGFGYLLREARTHFDYMEATDFAEPAAQRAAAYADKVHKGGLDKVADEARFDLVIANHVIEHVYDPVGFTRELMRRLKPGGTLVLSTPNMGSPWRRLMGRRWPSFKLPEHVLYFDRTSLQRLMQLAGAGMAQILPYPHAFPLTLVASKLRLTVPARLAGISLWIPGTTVALYALKEG